MNTPNVHPGQFVGQRRSQRVLLSVRISISGKRANGNTFEEQTSTLIVNAHGALIQLRGIVTHGEQLSMKNMKTEETLLCKVVDVNPGANGIQEVGVEFLQPNPKFWRVSFPPADWSPRNPEAKRVTSAPSLVPRLSKTPPQKNE